MQSETEVDPVLAVVNSLPQYSHGDEVDETSLYFPTGQGSQLLGSVASVLSSQPLPIPHSVIQDSPSKYDITVCISSAESARSKVATSDISKSDLEVGANPLFTLSSPGESELPPETVYSTPFTTIGLLDPPKIAHIITQFVFGLTRDE